MPNMDLRSFEVLFDRSEPATVQSEAYARYGAPGLAFPGPPGERPWTYSNFVQSLDGIVSLKGDHATGADLSKSAEDRWLMDLLRAHADAIILGVNTLVEETHAVGGRGPVYRIEAPEVRALRS